MRKFLIMVLTLFSSLVMLTTPASATRFYYEGQTVRAGTYYVLVPKTVPDLGIIRYGDDNTFIDDGYINIVVDVKGAVRGAAPIGANDFELTWTPKGGDMEYYTYDYAETYNAAADEHASGNYHYSFPSWHSISTRKLDQMILVFDIPADISDNSIGTIGLFFDASRSSETYFDLGTIG